MLDNRSGSFDCVPSPPARPPTDAHLSPPPQPRRNSAQDDTLFDLMGKRRAFRIDAGRGLRQTHFSTPMKHPLACLVAFSATAFALDLPGDFKGPLGLQLYSLRESFKTDVPGSLDKAKAFGFEFVETAQTYGLGAEKLKAMLDERGLKPVSGHFQYGPLKKDVAAAVAEAKALGLKFAVCPWIPHEEANFTEADVKRAAADFNAWGEAFKAAGITFAYHTY